MILVDGKLVQGTTLQNKDGKRAKRNGAGDGDTRSWRGFQSCSKWKIEYHSLYWQVGCWIWVCWLAKIWVHEGSSIDWFGHCDGVLKNVFRSMRGEIYLREYPLFYRDIGCTSCNKCTRWLLSIMSCVLYCWTWFCFYIYNLRLLKKLLYELWNLPLTREQTEVGAHWRNFCYSGFLLFYL